MSYGQFWGEFPVVSAARFAGAYAIYRALISACDRVPASPEVLLEEAHRTKIDPLELLASKRIRGEP